MTDRNSTTSPNSRGNLVSELMRNLRLAWALLNDPRVPALLKVVLPGLALGYLVMPFDLIPDFIPVLGQLDDLAVIVLLIRLFILLAPPDVVTWHRANLGQAAAGWRDAGARRDEDVVDAEFRRVD